MLWKCWRDGGWGWGGAGGNGGRTLTLSLAPLPQEAAVCESARLTCLVRLRRSFILPGLYWWLVILIIQFLCNILITSLTDGNIVDVERVLLLSFISHGCCQSILPTSLKLLCFSDVHRYSKGSSCAVQITEITIILYYKHRRRKPTKQLLSFWQQKLK